MATARVLVVDDDSLIRQMVRDLLEIASYFVEEAVDGADGLAQAAAVHPDLILLDLVMPNLGGSVVCRRLKADPATRAIPVICMTASPGPDSNRHATAAGAAACLTIPFPRAALLAAILRMLPGGGPPREEAGHLNGGRAAPRAEEAPPRQTLTCPFCHLPQLFLDDPSHTRGPLYCSSCGGPLSPELPAAARPPTAEPRRAPHHDTPRDEGTALGGVGDRTAGSVGAAPERAADDYWGVCPACGAPGAVVLVPTGGSVENWIACHACKTRWYAGANLFACEDVAPWEAKAEQFLREYREVTGAEPPQQPQG